MHVRHVPLPRFRHRLTSLWHRFFGTIALMEFVLKNPCQQLCSFSLAPCQRSNGCPMAQGLQTLAALRCTVFRNNRIDEICPEKPVPTAVHFECCPLPTKLYHRHPSPNICKPLEKSWAHSFAGQSHWWNLCEFCPENPCQQLCFSVRRFLPTELSPSYFPRFPFRPPCRHSRIAPSHLNSPQAISHGFLSVHPVVTPVSLLPTGALPKLFPTVSLPSALSSLSYRSFPPELSPSYFPRFPFLPPCRHSRIAPSHLNSPQAISHGFPFRPPCRHSHIAPSHRSSPQAISHGFPSVRPVVTPVSLLPTGALPKLFPTVSLPSTLSSLPHRSFPPELSPSYFPRFPHHIAPSHRSSPHMLFPRGSHSLVASISLLPTGALPKLFPTVSLPSTLSSLSYRSFPPELSPSYFPRFPFRPLSRRFHIAPSHRSSPQAISHGFPSVHPLVTSVSHLPTGTFSPCYFYFPRFPLRPLLVLPSRSFPTELSPSYFPRFPFRPPCRHFRIAPSPRSSPQAISHGFPSVHSVVTPVYRSFPPELSPSYFPRFTPRPPSRHSRILPTGALPKLFPTASHAICARMSLSSVWVSVPASTLEWAHRFSGKGWWLAQPSSPSPKCCFSRKWGAISQGMTPPRAHLFCFFCFFFPLFCCFVFAFLLLFFGWAFYLSSLRFLSKSVQFWRSPIRIGGLPFRLVACPLGRREPQHWSFFFGFTGSPRTSLFKFNVSSVFCASFTTLSRLIDCLFPCVMHLALSLFPGCISSVYILHISCRLLPTCILFPSMYSSFVKCAPFQVAFALSIFPPFAIFASFQLAPCFPIFSAIVMCASFRFALSISIFFALFLHSFQDVNILEHAQFDSTTQAISDVHHLVARFPLRPLSRRFHLAPFPRSSPQAISHGFPSVHHVVASISLLSHGALPKLFLTASPPSTLSTLPSLPSPRSSPQAISHGFPSVHPLVASVSLPHGKCN